MPTTDELKARIEASIPGARRRCRRPDRHRGPLPRRRSPPRNSPSSAGSSSTAASTRCSGPRSAAPSTPCPSTREQSDPMSTVEQQIREAIQKAISGNEVILFMKGTPEAPRCGFSARTVAALESLGTQFAAVDILPDPRIRQQLSALSELADDPAALRQGRAGRRRGHRRGDVRVGRARRGPGRRGRRRAGAAPEARRRRAAHDREPPELAPGRTSTPLGGRRGPGAFRLARTVAHKSESGFPEGSPRSPPGRR